MLTSRKKKIKEENERSNWVFSICTLHEIIAGGQSHGLNTTVENRTGWTIASDEGTSLESGSASPDSGEAANSTSLLFALLNSQNIYDGCYIFWLWKKRTYSQRIITLFYFSSFADIEKFLRFLDRKIYCGLLVINNSP